MLDMQKWHNLWDRKQDRMEYSEISKAIIKKWLGLLSDSGDSDCNNA